MTKEQEIKIMAAIEQVIENSNELEFESDYQYDLVCEAVEAGIKTVDPMFDADGEITETARKAGLDAGLLICANW